jgi:hypothetical protein
VCTAYLGLLAGEVVCRLQGTGDALVDGSVATVVGAQNRVLEASWVLDVDSELTVLAVLGHRDAGTQGGHVAVEEESHSGLIRRDQSTHGALRTTGSAISDAADFDLVVLVWSITDWDGMYLASWRSFTSLNSVQRRSRSREGNESEKPLHDG